MNDLIPKPAAIHRSERSFLLLLPLALALPMLLGAATLPPLVLDRPIDENGPFSRLQWASEPGFLYRLQTSSSLLGNGGVNENWNFGDALVADSTTSVLEIRGRSIPENSVEFYRLAGAETEIFSIEPAWVDSADPNAAFYIVGQGFPTNASVLLNGISFTATNIGNGVLHVGLASGALPGGSIISAAVSVIDNSTGATIATSSLQSPLYFGSEPLAEQLQGPAEEPPASPDRIIALWASRRGYDYYKAQSDMSAKGAPMNPAFVKNSLSVGQMPDNSNSRAGKVKPMRITMERGFASDAASRSGVGKPGDAYEQHADAVADLVAATGELQMQETDFAIPGRGLDFVWSRTYRSRSGPAMVLGAGWDHSFNVSMTRNSDGTVTLRPGNGRADTFYPDGTNAWTRDEYFAVITDSDADGAPDLMTFASGNTWEFRTSAQNPKKIDLKTIKERNRSRLDLNYDTSGLLAEIVDDLDRTNTLSYNTSGLLETITDFSGRVVRYEYDSNGDLVAVVTPGTPDFPSGITNRYTYSSGNTDDRLNHNLTGWIDGKGQLRLQVIYNTTSDPSSTDFDSVASVRRGIEKKDIRRGMVLTGPSNGFATRRAVVRDALGNVAESFYDSRQRCVKLIEYTGRVSPDVPLDQITLPPGGKLRSDDPDFYETRWIWNADSLCTSEIRPDASRTEMVYQRAFNQNSSRTNTKRHEGNLRVLREKAGVDGGGDLDGDGAPEFTELVWRFEYDSRFGTPAARYMVHKIHRGQNLRPVARFDGDNTPIIKGSALGGLHPSAARLKSGYIGAHCQGKDVVVTHASKGLAEQRDFSSIDNAPEEKERGFITQVTDPKGTVVTSAYNSNGDRLFRMRKRPEILYQAWDQELSEFYAYNSYGQLTGITNAPDANGYRRVDRLSYHASGPQAGYLASIAIDEPGVHLTTAFEYDSRGNVTRSLDPRGNEWLFAYDNRDRCIALQRPCGGTIKITESLSYDANDSLVRVDEENRDETCALVAGNPLWTTHYEYDAQNRLSSVAEEIAESTMGASYATNRFLYDAGGQLAEIHFPPAVSGADPHNIVAFEYDERGLLFRDIAVPGSTLGSTNEYSYRTGDGEFKELYERIDSPIRKGKIAYDGFGRPKYITDAMSNVVALVHDRVGNLTVVRRLGQTNDVPGDAGNRLLSETRYVYDSLDRCVQQVDSFFDVFTELPISDGQAVTTFTYAPNGALKSVTDDNGHTTSYAYDTAGRCSQITDPKTNLVQFTYDACDNITAITSVERPDNAGPNQQFTRTFAYDPLNRCVQNVDNAGNTNRFAYDSRGNVVSHITPKGDETFMAYNGLNQLVATTNFVGTERGITINTSHVEYQTTRRMASTDSNGNTTQYAYDSLDNCVSIVEADGSGTSLVWSPRSNLLRYQDANGTVISNSFDLLDRCVSRAITPGAGVAASTTFEAFAFDGLSRCVRAENDDSVTTFDFDSMGNCVRSTQDGLATIASYDGVGNRVSMTYPGGRVVTAAHNALNEIASLSSTAGGGLPPGMLATYTYDGPDRLARILHGNGVETRLQWNGQGQGNTTGDFGWRQISGVSHQKTAAGVTTVIDRRSLSYDRNQNKTLRAQTQPFFAGGPMNTNTFGYDALNRLKDSTKSILNVIRFYELDSNGNRLAVTENGVPQLYTMDPANPPADYQMNQYTTTPFGGQSYDENGNLRARGVSDAYADYLYDYADRLVLVQSVDSSSGIVVTTPVASYAYDALGRRISKTVYSSGLPPVTTQYVRGLEECDDGDPIEERISGAVFRAHTKASFFEQDGAAGESRRTGFKASKITFGGGTTAYVHVDDIGNALALTDDAGSILERYDYDDYGLPSFLSQDGTPLSVNASIHGNPFLFRGMEWDAEAGLYFASKLGGAFDKIKNNPSFRKLAPSASYYDPLTGRATRGKVKNVKDTGGSAVFDDNPWSARAVRNIGKHAIAGDYLPQARETQPFMILKKEEGGRHTPFHNKYRPQFRMIQAYSEAGESLINPIAMDKGLRFRIAPRRILKTFFEIGDRPVQDAFRKILDYGEAGDNVAAPQRNTR